MLATQRGSAHYPSMLEDVQARRRTEIDLITGALVREAERHGVDAPLHTALYRLIKAKEESYSVTPHPLVNANAQEVVVKVKRKGALGALLAVVAALAVARLAWPDPRRPPANGSIMIGWAFDSKGNMSPFDGPALAAAKVRVKQVNARGRRAAQDHHLRHAEQQPGQGQVVRAQPARPGRERHLHDLRRRLRHAGRAGGHQPRRARDRPVHRHRPDGPEALRRQGRARVQLRQRRAGRGLGHGAVGLRQGLAHGRDGHEHAARRTSRSSCRRSRPASSSSAARSSRTRPTRRAPTTSRRPSAG